MKFSWKGLNHLRTISQVGSLICFLGILYFTWDGLVDLYPLNIFVRIDPLVALSTILSSGSFESVMILSFVTVFLTFIFGRFFCGFICPLGTIQYLTEKLWAFRKKVYDFPSKWEYRELYSLKYYIFIAFCILALLGSNQMGILDPVTMATRSLAKPLIPAFNLVISGEYLAKTALHGFITGLLFIAVIASVLYMPRFYCRILCPLGAMLGILSSVSLFRIKRDQGLCKDCNACGNVCSGAANPHSDFRISECVLCFRCMKHCRKNAISYEFMPETSGLKTMPSLSRRRLIISGALPLAVFPLMRISKNSPAEFSEKSFNEYAIRPPNSLPEKNFIETCVRCGECVRICPTQVLQPAFLETGIEGIFSPVADFSTGYCQYTCTACGDICPTSAIQKFTKAQRIGNESTEPIRIGTAFFDYGRCLPHAFGITCTKCEELCPTAPKAIKSDSSEKIRSDGSKYRIPLPRVIPELCTGCGICEYVCPVVGKGIRVTAANETRSRGKKLLLKKML